VDDLARQVSHISEGRQIHHLYHCQILSATSHRQLGFGALQTMTSLGAVAMVHKDVQAFLFRPKLELVDLDAVKSGVQQEIQRLGHHRYQNR
jgi:hypothetical protein